MYVNVSETETEGMLGNDKKPTRTMLEFREPTKSLIRYFKNMLVTVEIDGSYSHQENQIN